MSATTRIFMAVELSEEIRSSLGRMQQRLRQSGARVSWVRPDNIHLTLVFIGDVFSSSGIPEIERAMDCVTATVPPFTLTVEGAGTFGSAKAPRVIWAGANDSSGVLIRLQSRLATAVRELGIPLESRPFHPHLTLGRVRSRHGADALTQALASASVARNSLEVDRVQLFESQLHPDGARHTILHSATLKGEP